MRRGLVHVLAWLLATGAAVTLSWWGVHTVMAGTAYDPPRALPITAADTTTQRSKRLDTSSTPPSPAPSRSTSPGAAEPTPSRSPAGATSPPPAAAAPSGRIRSYDTDGGRAVFDLGTADATLVSATPGTGWSMQVWKTATWIRVEFSRGTGRVSVMCTWHDGPPHVDVGNY
ncbi:hypothetical protein [Streptomyces sp. NPDC046759]|uniref:hypothetical protein n=1 Tax=Streptomyces sp. NPDC046759 TaxID=3155019 RepID=UPI0033DFBA1B